MSEPVACGDAPAGRRERLALAVGRRLGIPDTPGMESIGRLCVYMAQLGWDPEQVTVRSVRSALSRAGEYARRERAGRWVRFERRTAYLLLPAILLLVGAALSPAFEGPLRLPLLAAAVLVAWGVVASSILVDADARRVHRHAERPLLLEQIGLAACGGLDAMPARFAFDRTTRSHTFDADEPRSSAELFDRLGLDAWLRYQQLTATEREVFDVLGADYHGTLGELVATSRSLGGEIVHEQV